MLDAGEGTEALGGPTIDIEFALGAGVSNGADLWPVANTRLVVLFTVLAAAFAVALYNVGTGGGWITAVAGVTVTQVPLKVPAAPIPASTLFGLIPEVDVGLTARLETVNLSET